MKHLLLLSMTVLFLMSSCKGEQKSKTDNKDVTPEYAEAQSETADQVKFPIYDYEGLKPLLYKDDGKTYVINFWATWCKPCIVELPYFEQVYAEQKDNNVEVVLVSLDMPSMWKSKLEPFVEKKGLKSKVVILDDPKQNDWIPKIAEDWGGGIPATLIYSKNKRSFYPQGFTYEELNKEISKFIN
ncbi:TlpA family protein disulfide reductase [Flagellimonas hymeniacidonis]|uniref:TlpA family protein disulfide reductase n=1 Tax=Flagellimonas hymeniacidonis TaxID=2603628 RepID=A0A5C8V4E7_9FLAO|nr:TlpA disulfide reductase family protein [Flagellimonas hymeniacidonis]TXN36735.1 TlpA family protein disulfide reductase [Flagellimonas hymeniacidonis]